MYHIVGVFNGEGPPVPIPNTAVKLTSADNTCLETDREDRSTPTRTRLISGSKYASLAQSVEHAAVNRGVVGSSPTGGAIKALSIYAPLAQLVEQLTLNQWVPGSNP